MTPRYAAPQQTKLTIPELAGLKREGQKIVMVTAYDAPGGRLADAAGVDLVLVGDADRDAGFLNTRETIPAWLVMTDYNGLTATDSLHGDIDGDGLADVAIGRIPVRTREDFLDFARRVIALMLPAAGVFLAAFLVLGATIGVADGFRRFSARCPGGRAGRGQPADRTGGHWFRFGGSRVIQLPTPRLSVAFASRRAVIP